MSHVTAVVGRRQRNAHSVPDVSRLGSEYGDTPEGHIVCGSAIRNNLAALISGIPI